MNEKIKSILLSKNLSPSRFADEIGVQRSSISHILSGRNKPSLEIIQKIVKRFPELGLEWILDEDLPKLKAREADYHRRSEPAVSAVSSSSSVRQAEPVPAAPPLSQPPASVPVPEPTSEKTIERILVFFSDKTFTEYRPD